MIKLTKKHPWASVVGALLGIVFSGVVLVYLPMKANYERNGCVWLECSHTDSKGGAE